MAHVLLVQANSLRSPLKDQSVHCCITSPPYYGLRDYGTGEWQGGEVGCDHRPPPGRLRERTQPGTRPSRIWWDLP